MADGDVNALKKELDDVKLRLAKVIACKETVEPKVVFTREKRKLEKFSVRKADSQTLEEFIEDVDLTIKSRPTSEEEKVNFIISLPEGPAKEEIRYRPLSEKKTTKSVLSILREVFGERGTISELLSDFYICRQTENQTLQEFSHILMCKLDKICKRDHKCITDRDIVLRNQFAENVRPTWLKRELKKRIRGTHTISFNDIREEATLLMEDGDVQEASQQQDNRTDDLEVPIFATQAKPSGTPDIAKVLEDLKSELQSIKSEVKTLKEEKQGPYRKTRDCYYCGKPGHIKRNCRSFIRDQGNATQNKKYETNDLNENSLRQGAGP
ncbi:unnamed protein product [Mytilus coruscus]|uniref:CCHC-type domain-containing protein n=1 Tax=Mytilus coruscus TaxID=42192 RepID=A0A6J8AXX7_MYTCO|nr:unnamed protein product [Mytilus coruscus]